MIAYQFHLNRQAIYTELNAASRNSMQLALWHAEMEIVEMQGADTRKELAEKLHARMLELKASA